MVYFITDGNYTKIGVADNPEKRLMELQVGNPNELSLGLVIDGSYEEESKIHSMLRLYRKRGEWFDWSIFDKEVIELLLTSKPSGVVKNKRIIRDTRNEILNAISRLEQEGEFINAQSIVDSLNGEVSISTIRRYLPDFKNRVNSHNKAMFNTEDFNMYRKFLSVHKINKAIKVLSSVDEVISKRNVSSKANLHYNTVRNLWEENDVQEQLDKYNQIVK